MNTTQKWICCQIGARQHYGVPFSLQIEATLNSVITDIWLPPDSVAAKLNRHLAGRYHPGLRKAKVHAFNNQAIAFEAMARVRQLDGWRLIEKRNEWFQRNALGKLAEYEGDGFVLHSF